MKPTILILGAIHIALLAFGGVWLYAQQAPVPAALAPRTQAPAEAGTSTFSQVVSSNVSTAAITTPTVGTPTLSPSMIIVNTSTPVTITVQITGVTPIPGSVNLLLISATGTQPTILGVMQSSGNGSYSLQYLFNPSSTDEIQLQVSAAFQGQLRRTLSNIFSLNVWRRFADPVTGVAISLPQFAKTETLSSTPATSETGATLQLNVVDPVDSGYIIPLITFIVQTNSKNLSLQEWFENNVDYESLLLNAGDIHSATLSNGALLLTLQGPFPQAFLNQIGGPVASVYVMSPDQSEIITVLTPEDPALVDIGISPSSLNAMLPAILSTLTTP